MKKKKILLKIPCNKLNHVNIRDSTQMSTKNSKKESYKLNEHVFFFFF